MNSSRMAGVIGIIIGMVLVYAAYNSGDRVIVGALPTGQPIFDHVTNKPMLGLGSVLTAGSILLFAMSFVGASASRPIEIPEAEKDDVDSNESDDGADAPPRVLEDTRD